MKRNIPSEFACMLSGDANCFATLSLKSLEISPEEISACLGLIPENIYRIGDQIGRGSRVQTHHRWEHCTEGLKSQNPHDHLRYLLQLLKDRYDEWQLLRQKCECEIIFFVDAARPEVTFGLTPELIKELSALQIAIWWDVYLDKADRPELTEEQLIQVCDLADELRGPTDYGTCERTWAELLSVPDGRVVLSTEGALDSKDTRKHLDLLLQKLDTYQATERSEDFVISCPWYACNCGGPMLGLDLIRRLAETKLPVQWHVRSSEQWRIALRQVLEQG